MFLMPSLWLFFSCYYYVYFLSLGIGENESPCWHYRYLSSICQSLLFSISGILFSITLNYLREAAQYFYWTLDGLWVLISVWMDIAFPEQMRMDILSVSTVQYLVMISESRNELACSMHLHNQMAGFHYLKNFEFQLKKKKNHCYFQHFWDLLLWKYHIK